MRQLLDLSWRTDWNSGVVSHNNSKIQAGCLATEKKQSPSQLISRSIQPKLGLNLQVAFRLAEWALFSGFFGLWVVRGQPGWVSAFWPDYGLSGRYGDSLIGLGPVSTGMTPVVFCHGNRWS